MTTVYLGPQDAQHIDAVRAFCDAYRPSDIKFADQAIAVERDSDHTYVDAPDEPYGSALLADIRGLLDSLSGCK